MELLSVDESVIGALESALEREPGNRALRLHLAELLLLGGDAKRALEHAQTLLKERPDDAAVLATARDAARALGETAVSEGYDRLLGTSAPAVATHVAIDEVVGVDLQADEPFAQPANEGPEPPGFTLADVGGLDAVKERLQAGFLAPLRNPELRAYYGKSLRGGLLLYGPPGCGKTFLAKAVAGELGASFFAVGLSDVLDMYIGESERRLH